MLFSSIADNCFALEIVCILSFPMDFTETDPRGPSVLDAIICHTLRYEEERTYTVVYINMNYTSPHLISECNCS
jgi:hypothetical protein